MKGTLNPDQYTKHSRLQHSLAASLVEQLPITTSSRVLDIGCGDGNLTAAIAEKVPHGKVVGIDISEEMIRHARHYTTRFPYLSFEISSVEEITFTASFDIVCSFSAFHWVRNGKKGIQSIYDSLTPQGELILLAYPKESPCYASLDEALKKGYPSYRKHSAYLTMFSIDDYAQLSKYCPFDVYSFQVEKRQAHFNDEEALKNFIKGWLVSFVPLPEPLHDSLIELWREIQGGNVKNKTDIYLPYTTVTLKARK